MTPAALAKYMADELTAEMNLLRATILSAEKRGDWVVAQAAKKELSELHALQKRKEYSANH